MFLYNVQISNEMLKKKYFAINEQIFVTDDRDNLILFQ